MTRFAGTELGNYMDGPDFTGLGRTMMQGASLGRRAVLGAEGDVAIAGINSTAKVKSSGYEAEAIKVGGQARGQTAMWQGISSGVSSLAGGFAKRGGKSYGGTGSTGGLGETFNPNSVSKYGDAVQNPMDSFKGLSNTGPIYM